MTDVQALVFDALADAEARLVGPGDWLTGVQRRAAWCEVRDARTNELDAARRAALSPAMVDGRHAATDELPAEAVDVLHRITSDPGRLTRAWADEMIAALGEETYTELVGIAATAAVVDTFAWATRNTEPPIGDPVAGEPSRIRPDGVGDVGAWVAQSTEHTMANVSRSLSLVPVTGETWVTLVQALYSRGPEFLDLAWNRALSRPQVELVAARTTAELECFY
jgi:hypothetical protein